MPWERKHHHCAQTRKIRYAGSADLPLVSSSSTAPWPASSALWPNCAGGPQAPTKWPPPQAAPPR
jgi:hypothetical protein